MAGAAADVDAGGVNACLSAYLGGVGPIADVARVEVEFLGDDEKSLGRLQVGPVTPAQRKSENVLLRRAAQRVVPKNTRQLRVVITAEHFAGAATNQSARRGGPNQAYVDNISVALTKGSCEPVLTVKCVKKALVATVTSGVAATQRVRFAVKGGKTKQAVDGRAPHTAKFTMAGLTGRLTVTAVVTQKGGGTLTLVKKSKRC